MAHDEFNDVKNKSLGIFGDGGPGMESTLRAHDSVSKEVVREGLALEFECPGCGRTTQLLLEWPELVAMKYGHNPALVFQRVPNLVQHPMSMVYVGRENAWRPDATCPHCEFNFCIRVAPQEPEQALRIGRQQAFINPAGEAQVSQICASASRNPGGGWALPRQR